MCETCSRLASAVEIGAISVDSVEKWKRMFEADEGAARGLLAEQKPDIHQRLENAHAIVTHRPPELTDELVAAHEADLAARLGHRTSPLSKPDVAAVI